MEEASMVTTAAAHAMELVECTWRDNEPLGAYVDLETDYLYCGLLEAGPQQYARVYATFGTALNPKVGLAMADDFQDAELFARCEHEDSGESYRIWRERRGLRGSLTPPAMFG